MFKFAEGLVLEKQNAFFFYRLQNELITFYQQTILRVLRIFII